MNKVASYREIEKKFVVKDSQLGQTEIDYILERELEAREGIVRGISTDFYYKTSVGVKADFVRLRVFEETGAAEITVKAKDKLTNLNRLEINMVTDSADAAKAFCLATFGPEISQINKRYTVFFPPSTPGTVVSTYVIEGTNRVFLEVEAPSEQQVQDTAIKIMGFLDMKEERHSLYELYVKPKLPLTWGQVLVGGWPS